MLMFSEADVSTNGIPTLFFEPDEAASLIAASTAGVYSSSHLVKAKVIGFLVFTKKFRQPCKKVT